MNRPSPDDMKEIIMAEKRAKIEELEEENKKLKEEVKKRKMVADENWAGYDMMKDEYEKLEKENKEIKKKLEHYENTKAIQESNNASRWKPWCMSYVDRE